MTEDPDEAAPPPAPEDADFAAEDDFGLSSLARHDREDEEMEEAPCVVREPVCIPAPKTQDLLLNLLTLLSHQCVHTTKRLSLVSKKINVRLSNDENKFLKERDSNKPDRQQLQPQLQPPPPKLLRRL